jgi:AraC-like DNA-binding protein
MFRHGYIYHDILAEVGPLNDGKVRNHRSLQLIYGVNKPYRIRLKGEWQDVRICLIDQGFDHFISGEDDWQICFFIYPDSQLGHLFKSEILKGASVSILSQDKNPSLINTEQPAVRPMSLADLRGLLETFIFVFTGRKAYPRTGLATVSVLSRLILTMTDLTLSEVARTLNRSPEDLALDFKRETEMDIRTWLLHNRMIRFFDFLEKEDRIPGPADLEKIARANGISGLNGLDRLFEDFFGMPYMRWVNSEKGTVVLTESVPTFLTYR